MSSYFSFTLWYLKSKKIVHAFFSCQIWEGWKLASASTWPMTPSSYSSLPSLWDFTLTSPQTSVALTWLLNPVIVQCWFCSVEFFAEAAPMCAGTACLQGKIDWYCHRSSFDIINSWTRVDLIFVWKYAHHDITVPWTPNYIPNSIIQCRVGHPCHVYCDQGEVEWMSKEDVEMPLLLE